MHERTSAFRSVSYSQVKVLGEALHQIGSSIISSIDQRLSSSAAISDSGSTTSNPFGYGVQILAWFCGFARLRYRLTVNIATRFYNTVVVRKMLYVIYVRLV